ncbi:MAG: hypothetical protein HYY50_04260 [Candidatus Kerfeldbacteria bacterium]|nr:hypothetical protein [Candidatus Kerfeldbacteria bacterium]
MILQNNRRRGIASLPAVLAMVVFMVAVGVGLASSTFIQVSTSAGAAQSSQALFFAEAGARDALQRIARNKKYLCDVSNPCYAIDFVPSTGCSNNDGCARLTVEGDDTNKTITSVGQVKRNIRTIRVSVTLDPLDASGEITATSWSEI